jgi:hypothetical protein
MTNPCKRNRTALGTLGQLQIFRLTDQHDGMAFDVLGLLIVSL